MADWSDVRAVARALPDSSEDAFRAGTRTWGVRGKTYAWERPLRRSDLAALGDSAPDGPVLAVRLADLGAKEALLAENPAVYFTTPHFDGHPSVLVRLDAIGVPELADLLAEAYLSRAPKRLAQTYLDARP